MLQYFCISERRDTIPHHDIEVLNCFFDWLHIDSGSEEFCRPPRSMCDFNSSESRRWDWVPVNYFDLHSRFEQCHSLEGSLMIVPGLRADRLALSVEQMTVRTGKYGDSWRGSMTRRLGHVIDLHGLLGWRGFECICGDDCAPEFLTPRLGGVGKL